MSDVRRLPDKNGWWWQRGCAAPKKIVDADIEPQWLTMDFERLPCRPGEWIPCPYPEWPPEPPPRPRMVFASLFADSAPKWWVQWGNKWECDVRIADVPWKLHPHDHPEQSAEESRRILEEASREN